MEKTRRALYISVIVTVLCCVWLLLGAAFVPENSDGNICPTLTIVTENKSYVYKDEPIVPSDFTVQEQIETRKINSPLADKLKLVDECLARGADYKTALNRCFPLLIRTVNQIAVDMYVEPQSADVEYRDGKFTVSRDKIGRKLDEVKLYAGIYCALKFSGGGTVKAYTIELAPQTTSAELQSNLFLRATYTTDFTSSSDSRAHNVKLALSKLDGIKIDAGETLSFNGVVGERTERNGFKSAKIIVDGKYTDGIGGGVCQASTAVYNASLLAGLSCQANAHSICPSYCPAGLDAMISSVSDLQITNTTSHAVYFSAQSSGRIATVKIYGEKPEYTYKSESTVISTVPPEIVEQEDTEHKYFDIGATAGSRLLVSPGKEGIKSVTYLIMYKDGVFVKRIKLRENEYKSVPQVIAIAAADDPPEQSKDNANSTIEN